jgi:O-antigen/teichoic acid export membrane protein
LASIDAILAIGKFNVAAILEIITILIQISIYSGMVYFNVSSIAVAVFVALIISYLVCQTSCWMILISENTGPLKIPFRAHREFLKSTKHNHAFAISNGIVDRIDRIIIGWFLPLSFLGKFAITTSLISYVRFVPDAISKLIISRSHSKRRSVSLRTTAVASLLVISLVGVTVIFSQLFIKMYFGLEWVLPALIPLLFSLQEISRGFFQIECSRFMVAGRDASVAKQNIWMAVTAFPFCISGVKVAGLYGVSLSLCINYLLHTLLLHKQGRKWWR